MKRVFVVALVSLLSVGLAASASHAAGPMAKGGFTIFNNYDLIGVAVKNPQGRFLGLINEVLIGSDGQAFAVVNHGDSDLYGESGVNTPVPIAALRISETKSGKEIVVLNTDTEHMDFAPYLDPTENHDRQYEARIDRYFGIQPAWSHETSMQRDASTQAAPGMKRWEKVRGVVEDINKAAREVTVKAPKEELIFSIGKDTHITEVTTKMPFSALKKGTEVTVEYSREGNKLMAEWVDVHVMKTAAATHAEAKR